MSIHRCRRASGAAFASFIVAAAGSVASAQSGAFLPLGDLDGDRFESQAFGISADGSTVVGWSQSSNGREAFYWTAADGMTGMGDLDGGAFYSTAQGSSADGSILVGYGRATTIESTGFSWTKAGGFAPISYTCTLRPSSTVEGVSADGTVLVGATACFEGDTRTEAFRYTAADGLVHIGDFPGGATVSIAKAVSADGSVAYGYSIGDLGTEAFVWRVGDTGLTHLGDLMGGAFRSLAEGISSDGKVIVGLSAGPGGQRAVRWVDGVGPSELGSIAGSTVDTEALDASADGAVIVGQSTASGAPTGAFIWTEADGMRDLKQVAVDAGVAGLDGWLLVSAHAVSDDGLSVAGIGKNPTAQTEAYLLRLPGKACRPDCTKDGKLNINDFLCFQSEWRSRTAYGDYNGDGKWNVNDFIAFQASFREGCK